MGLNKIDTEIIKKKIEKVLSRDLILSMYRLVKSDIQYINNPTKIVNYDFTFVSEEYNRWLFIRLQDFFNKQKVVIWINDAHNKKNINIDVESYFIMKLHDNRIKQKLTFKASSENDLEICLENVFKYIREYSDDNFKNITLGKVWIDMPFDWGDYK